MAMRVERKVVGLAAVACLALVSALVVTSPAGATGNTVTLQFEGSYGVDEYLSVAMRCTTSTACTDNFRGDTNSDGSVSFSGVPAGTYDVSASDVNGDYRDFTQQYDVNGSDSPTFTLDPRPHCTTSAVVTGSPVVGQTLTGSTPTADQIVFGREPYTYAYSWWRMPEGDTLPYEQIDGATTASYTVTSADLGRRLEVDVEIVEDAADGASGYCDGSDHATDPVTVQPISSTLAAPPRWFGFGPQSGRPRGSAGVGRTLTAPTLRLPPGSTVSYQWYRVATTARHQRTVVRPIAVARRASYRLTTRDKGARVYVRMVVGAPGYTTAATRSAQVKVR